MNLYKCISKWNSIRTNFVCGCYTKMKIIIVCFSVLIVLGLGFQGWVMYVSSTEEQPYELLATFNEIEIRHYPPARMVSYQEASNKTSENNSFRQLAGYIFGGNSEQKEFAMTAPVHMERNQESEQMSFVLPKDAWNDSLPQPTNSKVELHWSNEQDVAAIKFSGFSTNELEEKYTLLLINKLEELEITHLNDFRILGYDPPFKMNNRRNEIIVSIDRKTLPQ